MAAILALAFAISVADASDILVVTDTQHPVKAPAETHIVYLDAPAALKAALTAQLPRDAEQAARIVRQRLNDGGTGLQRRFQSAYQDVTDAWRLGITQIPAVVVDRQYVIYGEPDVALAVARIQTYRSFHP